MIFTKETVLKLMDAMNIFVNITGTPATSNPSNEHNNQKIKILKIPLKIQIPLTFEKIPNLI